MTAVNSQKKVEILLMFIYCYFLSWEDAKFFSAVEL